MDAVVQCLSDAGSATSILNLGQGQVARILWVTLEGPIGVGKSELFRVCFRPRYPPVGCRDPQIPPLFRC